MKDTKLIKGFCSRNNRYFGLEIKQQGSEWKVVNIMPLSNDEGKMLTSEIRQSSFSTAANLRACPTCGSRKIGGCSCATRGGCRGPEKALINCAYCNFMQVDYSGPSYDTSAHRPGEVIHLSQGQEVKLSDVAQGGRLESIKVKCGWDRSLGEHNMDVDTSVVVCGSDGYDLIYFGDLNHPSGCVKHHGDDLTGGTGEIIDVNFKKVPSDRDKIIFVINIYKCEERHQTFGDVRNMYISLMDPSSNKPLVEYREMANMSRMTALVIGMAYRRGNEWFFKAEGRASRMESIGELADECYDRYRRS